MEDLAQYDKWRTPLSFKYKDLTSFRWHHQAAVEYV
jgi:hypothetical protein